MVSKSQVKSEAQIESDKKEMAELIERIIRVTSRAPQKVINEGSYQVAVAFKTASIAARKQAESKAPKLSKLRDAWVFIAPYYV